MQIYFDVEAINRDVKNAIEGALARHKIDGIYSSIAVCAVLNSISSPLKKIQSDGRLASVVGRAGTDAYICSVLLQALERIRNPASLIVSPVMECIAVALSLSNSGLPEEDLMRAALKIYLGKKRFSKTELSEHLGQNSSYRHAFRSATTYLVESGIVEKTEDPLNLRLVPPNDPPVEVMKRYLD